MPTRKDVLSSIGGAALLIASVGSLNYGLKPANAESDSLTQQITVQKEQIVRGFGIEPRSLFTASAALRLSGVYPNTGRVPFFDKNTPDAKSTVAVCSDTGNDELKAAACELALGALARVGDYNQQVVKTDIPTLEKRYRESLDRSMPSFLLTIATGAGAVYLLTRPTIRSARKVMVMSGNVVSSLRRAT